MKKIKINFKSRWLKITFLCLAIILLGALSFFRAFERFELLTYDLRFKLRPPLETSDDIAIIEIGNKTLQQLGTWPIDRHFHAVLIDILNEAGAKLIAFDLLFPEKSDSDDQLIAATEIYDNVYYSFTFDIDKELPAGIVKAKRIDTDLIEGLKSIDTVKLGHINVVPGIDGKRRKVPLVIEYQGKLYPQLALRLLKTYLGLEKEEFMVIPGKALYIGKRSIPIDEKGLFFINFAGTWENTFKHYSYFDILKSHVQTQAGEEPIVELAELKDKICFIGLTATGTHDLNPVPLESIYPMVGLHPNVFNSILQEQYIYRAPKILNLLILLLLSISLIGLILKRKPIPGLFVTLGLILSYVAISIICFSFFELWINLFYPILLLIVLYAAITFYKFLIEQKTRLLIEKEFSIAQRIQFSFLPQDLPKHEAVDVAVELKTAKAVGGDLYDFVSFEDENPNLRGIFIGDVSGKGMPAALYMAMTIAHFRVCSKNNISSSNTLLNLNEKLISQSHTGLFVTAFYMIFNSQNKMLQYSNAGHLPAAYYNKTKDKIEMLSTEEGSLIGLIDGSEFSQNEIQLQKGDLVVLYTDGVTEARNMKKQEFDEQRLKKVIKENNHKSAQEIVRAIKNRVMSFSGKAPQHDDFTIIVLKVI